MEAAVQSDRHKSRPACGRDLEVVDEDGFPGPTTVATGALVALYLEELNDFDGVAGGRHEPNSAGMIGQHQAGCRHSQDFYAPVTKKGEQVDDINSLYKGV